MKIEFFHDVICSFCFPMSDRMHEIQQEFPEIELIHRSFALGWSANDFETMFGSRAAVKEEVLTHWVHANQNDSKHRFNIEGMRKQRFDFPTSKNALLAAKAAGYIGNQDTYWVLFDKLQEGLFMRSLNIEEPEVIEELVKETTIDFALWKEAVASEAVWTAVQEDFALASAYGLQGVPALIINQKYLINGAVPKQQISQTIQKILAEEKQQQPLVSLTLSSEKSASREFKEGTWTCH
ncbi:DsbA family oxidoreductase [Enterococcus faecalis]|uniref:DsbA family oxidoreductase n=1 Tax=Enterococcus faecalis TaxID=1351 RepID=UPI0022E2B405|nr:DsbA family protein [Enterococcus faecalis]